MVSRGIYLLSVDVKTSSGQIIAVISKSFLDATTVLPFPVAAFNSLLLFMNDHCHSTQCQNSEKKVAGVYLHTQTIEF